MRYQATRPHGRFHALKPAPLPFDSTTVLMGFLMVIGFVVLVSLQWPTWEQDWLRLPKPDAMSVERAHYPPALLEEGVEGEARLRYRLDEAGTVTDLAVLSSIGSPAFGDSAMAVVRRWRYEPARYFGKMPAWVEQRFVFRIAVSGGEAEGNVASMVDRVYVGRGELPPTPILTELTGSVSYRRLPLTLDNYYGAEPLQLVFTVERDGSVTFASGWHLTSSYVEGLDAVTDQIRDWRFRPATSEGEPVATHVYWMHWIPVGQVDHSGAPDR